MISAPDLIPLESKPDLTQASVSLTCRSLIEPGNRETRLTTHHIRDMVAGVALDLAFRRFISQEHVPHQFQEFAPFTTPGYRNIAIGGRRCALIHTLVTHKTQIRQIRRNPGALLDTQAIVPHKPRYSSETSDDDIYIFGFLFGLVTPNLRSIKKAQAENHELYLVHKMPLVWNRSDQWRSLGNVVLKNGGKQTVNLEICGQDSEQAYQYESIQLSPGERALTGKDFYTMSILHTPKLPDGVVGIHSPTLTKTHLIQTIDWGNIWIYGIQVILAGYLTLGEFRQRYAHISEGSQGVHANLIHANGCSIPVADLKPLPDLFKRAKAWRAA